MQPSAHCIPESASGKYRDQGNFNDNADCQYDSGPGEYRVISYETVDQKFNAHTENGNASEKIDGVWQECVGNFAF